MPDHTDRKLEIVPQVPESAMVVFAHPDDAEIGSGGGIARWGAAGCDVTYVLWTNGDAGTADRNLAPAELAPKRAHAQRAAADFLGARHAAMLGCRAAPERGHRLQRAGGRRHRGAGKVAEGRAERGVRLRVQRGLWLLDGGPLGYGDQYSVRTRSTIARAAAQP